ncbi:preprotein translocase [Candidatus Saccharibacteria bacterium RIFCSPHIGHO2_12_FULL_42_8]|nr:MAG: preprotein translocase [Candidatus Saccharibacteria bacterium RIFCSPHIGHO2_12_FULL_42_8]
MELIDTHCHIHSSDYKLDAEEVYKRALDEGIFKMICVGTSTEDSRLAVDFAVHHNGAFASVGVHPHEAKHGLEGIEGLLKEKKVVAIGEIGLDYFYSHSEHDIQIDIFEQQLQLAQDNNLPVIFHVREAFDDFWPVLSNFPNTKGVLHSFTDSKENLEKALNFGLYIGVNGISTFTKDANQQAMFASIPLDSLLLETDSPYLTPKSRRGNVNEPVFVREVAEYISTAQSTPVDELAIHTTRNATNLFHI